MIDYLSSIFTDHQIDHFTHNDHILIHNIEVTPHGNLIVISSDSFEFPIVKSPHTLEYLLPTLIKSLIITQKTYDLYSELETYLEKYFPDFNVGHETNCYDGAYVYRHYYPNESSNIAIEAEGDHETITLKGVYSIGNQPRSRELITSPQNHKEIKDFIEELLNVES